jgi:hypothetical protein
LPGTRFVGWSTPATFTVIIYPLVNNPPDYQLLARTTFGWTDVPGATGYPLQLSTTNTFSSLVWDQTVPMAH